MSEQVIYVSAPDAVRTTDRYEEFFYRIAHHFQGAELLEARELFPTAKAWMKGWKDILERIDTLVFIRNEERAIGHGTWTEMIQAHNAGKQVLLARMNRENELVLIPWEQLSIKLDKASKRNYAKIGYMRPPVEVPA
jgi:hypothetical protein